MKFIDSGNNYKNTNTDENLKKFVLVFPFVKQENQNHILKKMQDII